MNHYYSKSLAEFSDVYRLTLPVSNNWTDRTGSELNFPRTERTEVNTNQSNDDRLEEVLHQWLNVQLAITPPTWLFILSGLERAEINEIVEDFLGEQNVMFNK